MTLTEWLGIAGAATALLTVAAAIGGLIRWAVKREEQYVGRAELERMEARIKAELDTAARDDQVERDRLETRINQRVNQLDSHVQTIESMWVAKGKD